MEHKELVALLGTLPVKANTLTALEETLDHMLTTTKERAGWIHMSALCSTLNTLESEGIISAEQKAAVDCEIIALWHVRARPFVITRLNATNAAS